MTTPREHLSAHAAERSPEWLMRSRGNFDRDDFFRSRTVFYPACGRDGHPLRTFGGSRSASCFVFVDHSADAGTVQRKLEDSEHRKHPRGYTEVYTRHLTQSELRPGGWTPHVTVPEDRRGWATYGSGRPFALWSVLEREPHLDNSHGAERLAILFIRGEGIATFDALYCQGDASPPFALLLQDHGFGGQWARFGGETSPLYTLARDHDMLPEWLLTAHNTRIWPDYKKVSSEPEGGGWYHQPRSLWRR